VCHAVVQVRAEQEEQPQCAGRCCHKQWQQVLLVPSRCLLRSQLFSGGPALSKGMCVGVAFQVCFMALQRRNRPYADAVFSLSKRVKT
jgi:hypothetical protein